MKRMRLLLPLLVGTLLGSSVSAQETYDVVVAGGRVVDPASGFDGVANVGIVGHRIAAVTSRPLQGRRTIDARRLVVAPGFVDILAGGISPEGERYKAMDGVTTLLSMHGGPVDVAAWYDEREASRPVLHYGTTVGHGSLREAVGVHDREAAATAEQLREMVELARQAIMDGAVGIGFGVQYVPGASEDEVLELFRVAAEMGVPCHLHTRFLGPVPPENAQKGVQEVIADAAATGASAQIVHLPAMAGHDPDMMRTVLRLIEGAQEHGVDVMADAYPWNAGSTSLESAVFDPGWQERMLIGYGDIQVTRTGEPLTEASFKRYREDGEPTSVIIFHVKEESTDLAYGSPYVMVGSDGGIRDGAGHPRGAGTYGKFLREYVREKGQLTLMEAIRKMSTLPAERMMQAAPVMRRKGRLSLGADADLVIFDPERVRERATYQDPAQYSEGFEYVLVLGVPVVDGGALVESARPGRAIRGAPARAGADPR